MTMLKYNEETVINYINGEDIEKFSLEELENDSFFMYSVIKRSKDVRLYDNASDEVKKSFAFVYSLVEIYKNNIDFIIKIVDYYFENNKDFDFKKIELLVILNKIIKDERKEKYVNLLEEMYEEANCYIENHIDNKNDFNLGFKYINYPHSKEFFATKFVEEILFNNDILKEFSKENKKDLSGFMIEYINKFDSSLADYLKINIKILDRLKTKFEYYIRKLEFEQKESIIRKFNIIWQEGNKLYNSSLESLGYCFIEYYDSVLYNNNLLDLYKRYVAEETEELEIDFLDEECLNDFDKSFYKYLDEKTKQLFC